MHQRSSAVLSAPARLMAAFIFVCALSAGPLSSQAMATPAGSGIASIASDDGSVTVTLCEGVDGVDGPAELVALGVHQGLTDDAAVLWSGTPSGQRVVLPRFDEADRDRLFQRFVLRQVTDSGPEPVGAGRFVEGLEGLTATGTAEPWPTGIKGIQDPTGYDDLAELGMSHITNNISIATLIAGRAGPDHDPEFTYSVDGVAYAMRPEVVRRKDEFYRTMHDMGINVIAIILCYRTAADSRYQPEFPADGRLGPGPLYHPDAEPARMIQRITAVNLATAEGQRAYRAVMGFLARRYSRADNRYGRLGGYIIGNEVNSHWIWHHMDEAEPEDVISQYALQVRLSYLAARLHNPEPRVYLSMDHFWSIRYGDEPLRTMPGRELLDRFAQTMALQGDLPWGVAHHPYPENLFDPAFWEDETAWLAYDTPRITYHNIEVLVEYLRRPALRYRGEPRSLIFSEQGFHAGDTEHSEQVQAAAYALAHYKLSHLEGVDAHVLHRHTDHPHEGGLLLGVRACDAQGRPTRKRPIFEVFASAGTQRQEEAFAFALPIIGLERWEDARPATGPFPETRP